MKNHFFIIIAAITISTGCTQKSQIPPYKDSTLTVDERVQDLLSRMTPEEKFWQMFMIPGDLSDGKEKYKHGIFGLQVSAKAAASGVAGQMLNYDNTGVARATAEKINEIQKFFVEETRLGIPIIPFDEALHGLVRKGATAFPEAIGLAATWDTTLMHQVALAIAEETKSRGIRQILSPVINIARDARWGRVEETYGEDPRSPLKWHWLLLRLSSKMGSLPRQNILWQISVMEAAIATLFTSTRDYWKKSISRRIKRALSKVAQGQ